MLQRTPSNNIWKSTQIYLVTTTLADTESTVHTAGSKCLNKLEMVWQNLSSIFKISCCPLCNKSETREILVSSREESTGRWKFTKMNSILATSHPEILKKPTSVEKYSWADSTTTFLHISRKSLMSIDWCYKNKNYQMLIYVQTQINKKYLSSRHSDPWMLLKCFWIFPEPLLKFLSLSPTCPFVHGIQPKFPSWLHVFLWVISEC